MEWQPIKGSMISVEIGGVKISLPISAFAIRQLKNNGGHLQGPLPKNGTNNAMASVKYFILLKFTQRTLRSSSCVTLFKCCNFVMIGCLKGTYGRNCIFNCTCSENSECDPESGECRCHVGWIGSRCEHGKLTFCFLFLPAAEYLSILISPSVCPAGTFGLGCQQKCSCYNGLCDHVNGKCHCHPGYQGVRCERGKNKGTTSGE